MAGRRNKLIQAFVGFLDPRVYLHVLRLIHFYNYSHVQQRRKMRIGKGTKLSPNLSIRNGERITVGIQSHLGERCFLWAGDLSGEIIIGNQVSFAPGVFVTASDYRFEAGVPFRHQEKKEQDVVIGDDVWLGAGVIVTAGVRIGEGCIVGAGAVVTKDLAAGSIAVGVPAKVIASRTRI
jgi:acetyltransferase-like isoleucine patch superfamily enzyme